MSKGIAQEQPPFDIAWRIIDGLKVRYATNGSGSEKVVLLSPWPESIFARLLWRWRWFRVAVGLGGAGVGMWVLAWSLSGLGGP